MVFDTQLMEATACYEGDSSGCNNVDFGSGTTSSPTNQSQSGDVSDTCDPRTTDKGIADGYQNKQLVKIRLCEIPNLDGAQVNAQISGKTVDMITAAKAAGITLGASESFRTMEQQQYFWNCFQTKSCNSGNTAAEPGTSNHQMGLAIDFRCNGSAMTYSSPCYTWLQANAATFGFQGTVPGEPWHWSRTGN
jgi:LAS superfamily LD-carboxypeptidase LdcB